METQQEGSLKPAEYLDIYQCAAKSAAAEKSVLRRKICVVVLFLTMLPYNDVFPPSCFAWSFLLKDKLSCVLMLKWKSAKIQTNQYPLEFQLVRSTHCKKISLKAGQIRNLLKVS